MQNRATLTYSDQTRRYVSLVRKAKEGRNRVSGRTLIACLMSPKKGQKMTKPLTVKVSVAKVIDALTLKLTQLEKDFAEQAEKEAKYQKVHDAWKKQAAKILVDNFAKAKNIKITTRYNGNKNIDFDIPDVKLPAQPERDFTELPEWRLREIKEEISNAIRILRMTHEEVVSTSTMKFISQYL